MIESETIKHVDSMSIFEKLSVYMNYFINMYEPVLPRISFENFCSNKNIITHNTGVEDWKERGFASKLWTVFKTESMYYYIHHSIK